MVNQVRPRDLDEEDLVAVRAGQGDQACGRRRPQPRRPVRHRRPGRSGCSREARDHAERRALEDAQRALVARLGVPTYELPLLVGGVDLGGLYELAGLLRDQGMA